MHALRRVNYTVSSHLPIYAKTMRLLVLLCLFSFAWAQPHPAFQIEEVASNLGVPWSLRFAPDGRLFFTQRNNPVVTVGALDLRNGQLTFHQSQAPVRNEGEAGVMGLELDPGFARNNKLYIPSCAT